MSHSETMEMAGELAAHRKDVHGWQTWAPYAAVAWSLAYALLGIYWAFGGGGFPYPSGSEPDLMGPLLGRFGSAAAWSVVILAGIPAAAMGAAMLRGVSNRVVRPVFITAGALLAGVLLLLMVGLDLLVLVGYIPYTIAHLFNDERSLFLLKGWTQWNIIHELVCMLGGFLWLGSTVVYARRSADACLYCGRRDGSEGWTSPDKAARWTRIAVYVGIAVPVIYALTRYAWAAGIPLGMTEEYLRQGQADGRWISGAFLATFGVVGGLLMLGLIQRWGERFPRWMIGLAGRRVPISLAVVPAALASVLLVVGGIVISAGTAQMANNAAVAGVNGAKVTEAIIIQVGPTLLFPVWGAALAVAALGYYFRRRGPCSVCGRGGKGADTPRVQ